MYIELIEGLLEVIETIDEKTLEEEYVPNLLRAFRIEHNPDEITERMAKMVGRVVHKLSPLNLHLKYKTEILTFYKAIC